MTGKFGYVFGDSLVEGLFAGSKYGGFAWRLQPHTVRVGFGVNGGMVREIRRAVEEAPRRMARLPEFVILQDTASGADHDWNYPMGLGDALCTVTVGAGTGGKFTSVSSIRGGDSAWAVNQKVYYWDPVSGVVSGHGLVTGVNAGVLTSASSVWNDGVNSWGYPEGTYPLVIRRAGWVNEMRAAVESIFERWPYAGKMRPTVIMLSPWKEQNETFQADFADLVERYRGKLRLVDTGPVWTYFPWLAGIQRTVSNSAGAQNTWTLTQAIPEGYEPEKLGHWLCDPAAGAATYYKIVSASGTTVTTTGCSATRTSVTVVLGERSIWTGQNSNNIDAYHPTDAGHRWLAEQIRREIER